jgi:hypothetical protein
VLQNHVRNSCGRDRLHRPEQDAVDDYEAWVLAPHLHDDVATHRTVTEHADVVDRRVVADGRKGPGGVERCEVEPCARHLRVLDGVPHHSDTVATLLQLCCDAEGGGDIAASVPRDEEEVAHDASPWCRVPSSIDVTMRWMSCSVRARE